jgi:hypothetical protein
MAQEEIEIPPREAMEFDVVSSEPGRRDFPPPSD